MIKKDPFITFATVHSRGEAEAGVQTTLPCYACACNTEERKAPEPLLGSRSFADATIAPKPR